MCVRIQSKIKSDENAFRVAENVSNTYICTPAREVEVEVEELFIPIPTPTPALRYAYLTSFTKGPNGMT